MTFLKTLTTTAAVAALGLGTANAAHMAFTLGDDGATLVSFAPDTPGDMMGVALTGDAATLDALAFRPNTGELYGYDDDTDSFYTVDPQTGATSLVVQSSVSTESDTLGFDFNNEVDAARLVTIADQNIVFFPDEPSTQQFTDVEYAEGDPNAGTGPEIVANAYTNQVPNAASTLQFGLDSELNTLVTIANNEGTLNTVGDITLDGMELDFDPNAGFDIFTNPEGEDIAYALLTTQNEGMRGIGFYTINLATAEAMFEGLAGTDFGILSGLAVFVPEGDVIPLPAGAILFATGAAALGAARRRKAAA